MNKKLISLGLIAAMSLVTISAMAESTIYTDGIGRMHFLGRDAANNTGSMSNYSNSAEQDLTRKLYQEEAADGTVNDYSYDQHPLKNYENTFPDSRFGTAKYWKTKYANGSEDAVVNTKDTVKATATATKGKTDISNPYAYGSTFLENENSSNKTNSTTTKKKHWWNKD